MERTRILILFGTLIAGPAWANEPLSSVAGSSTAVPQACQATSTTTCSGAPAWQAELEHVQKSWNVCQKEIDQFCEGVQVGEGRLENCLKAHQKKLSPACRKAQGLK